jgi:hypothetical protein
VKITRLSCHRFRSNEVRLCLSVIAYNLGNLWRRLVVAKRIDKWSLTSGGTEKAVAALEQQWLQAQKTNSPDLLAPLLADKVVVTEGDGKVSGKAETLATYKKSHWDSAEYTACSH